MPEYAVIVKAISSVKNVIERKKAHGNLVSNYTDVAYLSHTHLVKSRRNGYPLCVCYKISVETR